MSGFTLVEVAVVLALVVILGAAGYSSLALVRPRANLNGTASEIAGLLYNARQNSLATGHHTVVLFLPQVANGSGGVGRVVAYEDSTYTFFSATPAAGATTFASFSASGSSNVNDLNLVGEVELPKGIAIGLGDVAAPSLPAPYDSVTVTACNFCSSSGDGRGAVVFDSRGAARFFSTVGSPLTLRAGTIALTGSPAIKGHQVLFITPTTGAVRTYTGG